MNRHPSTAFWLKLSSACVLSLGLVACGSGDSDDAAQGTSAPDFSGTYQLTMSKTRDSCNSGIPQQTSLQQTVSQAGRTITLTSNDVTASGQVDGDNAGFSVSAQTLVEGVPVSYGAAYRQTGTPGLYTAGLSIVATSGGVTCTVTYGGEARRL
jgi:hypothetical protein